MKSRTSTGFPWLLGELPQNVRPAALRAYKRFTDQPGLPGLPFKRLRTQRTIVSAVGELRGDSILWFWIGPHREYDKLIGRL